MSHTFSNTASSSRAGLMRICLALGVAFCGAATVSATTSSAATSAGSAPMMTAFFAPAGGTLLPPGFSGGSYPGFQLSTPSHLEMPVYRGPTPAPTPVLTPVPESRPAPAAGTVTDADRIQALLTRRYENPVVGRLLSSLTIEGGLALYREVAQLIDARHLAPASYDARTRQAVTNLMFALENPAFLEANRVNPAAHQVASFGTAVEGLLTGRTVRSSTDAMNVMNWTIDLAVRQLGLRPAAVALEFVYGATEALDRYSAFEPSSDLRAPSANLSDHVVGIGVEIKPHAQGVEVVRPLPGGPAATAGLKSGDLIVAINGQVLAGRSLDFAVDRIAGPIGTQLSLSIVRDGKTLPAVTLTRNRVVVPSVTEVRMLDGDEKVGYIKLERFAQSSEEEMENALWSLHRQGMRSLVLDLRGNPGGLLTTAIRLSNKFLPGGTIVSTSGRTAADRTAEKATYDRTWSVPLVVLVDGNSASASEIFAAAIQENRRGLVVGDTTFGKGTVQTHFSLSSVSGTLRLTTAQFFSPGNNAIADVGVAPDVKVEEVRRISGSGLPVTSELDAAIATAMAVATTDRLREMALALSRVAPQANLALHQRR